MFAYFGYLYESATPVELSSKSTLPEPIKDAMEFVVTTLEARNSPFAAAMKSCTGRNGKS